jgi:hypothetical protein
VVEVAEMSVWMYLVAAVSVVVLFDLLLLAFCAAVNRDEAAASPADLTRIGSSRGAGSG